MLLKAAERGDCQKVRSLVEEGAFLEDRDDIGRTPLLMALAMRQDQAALLLLDLGADPNASNKVGATPLYFAVSQNNTTLLDKLLEKKAKIDHSILTEACVRNRKKMLEMMLQADDSSINVTDARGHTLIMQSILNEHFALIDVLIKYKCKVDAKDNDQWTALHHAVSMNNVNAAKTLIKSGANFKCFSRRLIYLSMLDAISNNNYEMIILCFDEKRMGKFIASHVKTILDKVMSSNNSEIMNVFKNYFVNIIEEIDDRGRNVLMIASSFGKDRIVNKLIEWGLPKNARDVSGRDALYLATWEGHLDVVKVLLNSGYKSAYSVANHPDDELMKYPNSAFIAIDKNINVELINMLVASLSIEEIRDNNDNNETLLHLSVLKNYADLIPTLIGYGIDCDVKNVNNKTALMLASENKNLDMVTKILAGEKHYTANEILIREIENQNIDNVKHLIICGATVNENHIKTAIDLESTKVCRINYEDLSLKSGQRLIDTCLGILLMKNNIVIHGEFAYDYAIKSDNKRVFHLFCDAGIVSDRLIYNVDMQCLLRYGLEQRSKRNGIKLISMNDILVDLHNAVEMYFVRFLISFMNSPRDCINKYSTEGETPLHKAIRLGKEDIAVYLIQHGADCRMSTDELSKCRLICSDSLYRLLIEAGADVNPRIRTLEQLARIAVRKNANFNSIWNLHRTTINVPAYPYGTYDINSVDGDGNTALHYASNYGWIHIVQALIEDCADLNLQSNNGCTAVALASLMGHADIVLLLINNGADIRIRNNSMSTPLMLASQSGDLDIINLLIQTDPRSINMIDMFGYSALHLSIKSGHSDICFALLKSGADPLLKERELESNALHIAAAYCNADIILHLIKRKIDLKIVDRNGHSALIIAAGKGDLNIIQILLNEDSKNINAPDIDGHTALHYAIEKGRNIHVVDILLNTGANPSSQSKYGYSPLHFACIANNIEMTRLLLNAGADILSKNDEMQTALMFAVEHDNLNLVNMFIDAAPDLINLKDNSGNNALGLASKMCHINIVEVLLNNGADLSLEDGDGYTALHHASQECSGALASLLIERGADVGAKTNLLQTALMLAAQYDNLNTVNILLEADLNMIDSLDINGQTALHYSAVNGNTNVSRALLDKGANIHIQTVDGDTALLYACKCGQIDLVELLLNNGADAMVRNYKSISPLMISARTDKSLVIEMILKSAPDSIDLFDNSGMSALFYAVSSTRLNNIKVLLDGGADVNHRMNKNISILHVACLTTNADVVSLLIKHGADLRALDEDSNTVLVSAVSLYDINMMNMILDIAPDLISATDCDGLTILHVAMLNRIINEVVGHDSLPMSKAVHVATLEDRIDVVKLLLNKGANASAKTKNMETVLMYAAMEGDVGLVNILNDAAPEVINEKNNRGLSALHIAVVSNQMETAMGLLELGADCNTKAEGFENPFMFVCYNGHLDLVTRFIQSNVDVRMRDKNKMTALMVSVWNDNTQIMKLLLNIAPDLINLIDNVGCSALHHAVKESRTNAAIFLLISGADVNIRSNEGDDVLQLACKRGNIQILNLLLTNATSKSVLSM